jgi:uncharacterized protein YhfF
VPRQTLAERNLSGAPPLTRGPTLRRPADSDGRRVGIIETLAVDVIRLGDADLRLAVAEGEGFESVAHWRAEHERFWNDEVLPTLPAEAAVPLSDETRVVVQRFRLTSTR